VLDTADFAAGPVATVRVPIPLRMAFHGEFITGDALGWSARAAA